MQTSLNNTMATTHDDSEQFDDTEQQGGIAWRETALIIVSLIAIAALAMLWINRLPAEGSSEVVFARDMIAHHEQAVEMAAYLNQRLDTDEGMRLFTFDMMISQKGQIGQMQGWLQAWGHPLASGEPPMQGMGEHMGMASREQVQALETLPIEEAEIQFLQLMIRHHQGGVYMAEDVLEQTKRPEVVQLAQAIIAAQESEIKYMTELLAKRNAEPLPPLPRMKH
jgi:Uncharacterized protein conserved in bacteria